MNLVNKMLSNRALRGNNNQYSEPKKKTWTLIYDLTMGWNIHDQDCAGKSKHLSTCSHNKSHGVYN